MNIDIEPAVVEDYPRLLEIWSNSVLATHDFLAPNDYAEIKRRLIPDYFPSVALYKAVDQTDQKILGFLGVLNQSVEMLFIDACARGLGVGKTLLDYAVENLSANQLEVNEQNKQALGFYLHYGCRPAGRSELDGAGRPYPTLTLTLP